MISRRKTPRHRMSRGLPPAGGRAGAQAAVGTARVAQIMADIERAGRLLDGSDWACEAGTALLREAYALYGHHRTRRQQGYACEHCDPQLPLGVASHPESRVETCALPPAAPSWPASDRRRADLTPLVYDQ